MPGRRQHVHDSSRERSLWTDDGEVHPFTADHREDVGRVAGINGKARGLARDAGVAGRTEEGVHAGFAAELPAQRVLARAAPEYEYTHDGVPVERQRFGGPQEPGARRDRPPPEAPAISRFSRVTGRKLC